MVPRFRYVWSQDLELVELGWMVCPYLDMKKESRLLFNWKSIFNKYEVWNIKYNNMYKTKIITSIFNSLHPKAVQSPLNIFWISGLFKHFFLIWNHKWRDYRLEKVRVTDTRHCTESERININLQVVNYWLLEMKSLNYEEVFFVELKWILWISTP